MPAGALVRKCGGERTLKAGRQRPQGLPDAGLLGLRGAASRFPADALCPDCGQAQSSRRNKGRRTHIAISCSLPALREGGKPTG